MCVAAWTTWRQGLKSSAVRKMACPFHLSNLSKGSILQQKHLQEMAPELIRNELFSCDIFPVSQPSEFESYIGDQFGANGLISPRGVPFWLPSLYDPMWPTSDSEAASSTASLRALCFLGAGGLDKDREAFKDRKLRPSIRWKDQTIKRARRTRRNSPGRRALRGLRVLFSIPIGSHTWVVRDFAKWFLTQAQSQPITFEPL